MSKESHYWKRLEKPLPIETGAEKGWTRNRTIERDKKAFYYMNYLKNHNNTWYYNTEKCVNAHEFQLLKQSAVGLLLHNILSGGQYLQQCGVDSEMPVFIATLPLVGMLCFLLGHASLNSRRRDLHCTREVAGVFFGARINIYNHGCIMAQCWEFLHSTSNSKCCKKTKANGVCAKYSQYLNTKSNGWGISNVWSQRQ